MTVKTLVTMAKDLELHEHYSDHQAGRDCGSDPTECLVKTRIWQNIFICEMMIGGPQGTYHTDRCYSLTHTFQVDLIWVSILTLSISIPYALCLE